MEHTAAIALALYAEGVGQGRPTSYSRSKPHYERPQRYRSRLYTYRKVVGAVNQLEELRLIDHQKTKPGDRGWQSSMLPTPELLELVHSVVAGNQLQLAPLSEPMPDAPSRRFPKAAMG